MRACLDLTALATPDRFRGIGRYVDGLSRGLEHLAPERSSDAPPLDIYALITEGRSPRAVPLGQGLAWAKDPPCIFSNFTTYNLWKRARVPAALKRAGVDLYHAPDPKGTPRLRSERVVVTCHDLIPYMLGAPYLPRLWPRPAQRMVERRRYLLPDHVIAISSHTRRDLQQVTGLADEKVSVIYHGIDREIFTSEPDDLDRELVDGAAGPGPYFLYVGAFDPRRQVDLLLAAFSRAAPTIEERLVLVGSPYRAQRAKLEAQLQAMGIKDRVIILEQVPEETLTALYRRATGHVMLSKYEGFGMTLFEAMACGCPVLALDASCAAELCGEGALLLPPGSDETEVAEELVRLAGTEELRLDQRARGLDQVARFTWERCARETLAVYQRTLGVLS